MHRVVFMGTPEFAVPSLQALVDQFEVVGVVTQPDRPAGRGQQVRQSAVKQKAVALDLPVFQPKSLRRDEAVLKLRTWAPDVIVVAAFGQILRPTVLDLPPHGCINVHASLLPRWRGAAPIQYAIRAGDEQTGVTIMKMDPGLDTGPMLMKRAIPIAPEETAGSLHDKLAALGAALLPEALTGYLNGDITPEPQPDQGVTLAPTLSKDDGAIDWGDPADAIDRQVRAYDPWPGTFTTYEGDLLKVKGGTPLPEADAGEPPGTLVALDEALCVQTGAGLYRLHELQPAGKRTMSAEAFLAGRPEAPGTLLGEETPA
ncbi:MAG: methionyl-tRNA formyltransferase [Anaerolineae bacterium]